MSEKIDEVINELADRGAIANQTKEMVGKDPGWWEGYWGYIDEKGQKHLGGSTFIPSLKRAEADIQTPPVPLEPRGNLVMYWDGKTLSASYHE